MRERHFPAKTHVTHDTIYSIKSRGDNITAIITGLSKLGSYCLFNITITGQGVEIRKFWQVCYGVRGGVLKFTLL